jgi:hypothetical protein
MQSIGSVQLEQAFFNEAAGDGPAGGEDLLAVEEIAE